MRSARASGGLSAEGSALAVSVSDLLRNGQDGVRIDGAVIICKYNPVLFVAVHPFTPAVSAEEIGDAMEGVRLCKGIDSAVSVGIHAVGRDVGGHELAQSDRPVDRSPDGERIDPVLCGVVEQSLKLSVSPVGLLSAAATD